MPTSLVNSKSVLREFITLFVKYPLCFFLYHNQRLHKLNNYATAYLKNSSFLFHVLDFNAIFESQDPLLTLRPGNFDLYTKIPGSAPA